MKMSKLKRFLELWAVLCWHLSLKFRWPFHIFPITEGREKWHLKAHKHIAHPRSTVVDKSQNPKMSVMKELFWIT